MDNMFQLKQDTTLEELQKFGISRVQEERRMEEKAPYLQMNPERILKSGGAGLEMQSTKKAAVSDMPQQKVDEKESARKKRETKQLKSQIQIVEEKQEKSEEHLEERSRKMWEEKSIDQEGRALFEEVIDAQILTPRYVLEHFSEVREKLDQWKEHIKIFSRNENGKMFLSYDMEVRLSQMQEMYLKSEEAFKTALGALGYRYHPEEKGEKKLTADLTPEEKKQMLEQNRQKRKEIEEDAQKIDEKTMQEMLQHKSYASKEDSGAGLRKEMSENPDYAFIHSSHLNRKEQFDTIAEVKTLLEKYPQEYEANKESLNKLYQEIYNLMEADAKYKKELSELEGLEEYTKESGMKKISQCAEKRRKIQMRKIRRINRRAESMKAGIRHLLFGEELKERDVLVLKEYVPEKHAQISHAAEAQAGIYAQKYKEKHAVFESTAKQMFGERAKELIGGSVGRYMMLMKIGDQKHNEAVLRSLVELKVYQTMEKAGGEEKERAKTEIGRVMKPLVIPYLERIKNYDTKALENCTAEELIAKSDELQEFSLFGMHISDMGKYRDPDDVQGRSIKEVFCDGKDELFALKCGVIQSYADKARAFAMIRAYAAGGLSEVCFTEIEKERKIQKNPEGMIDEKGMLDFAKKLLERAMCQQDASYDKYFKSAKIQEFYKGERERTLPSAHPEYRKELDGVLENGKEILDVKKLQMLYNESQQKAAQLEKIMRHAGGEDVEKLKAELTALKRRMEIIQIKASLTRQSYKRAGDQRSFLKEPLFRSYEHVEGLPSFRSMSEEEFRQMCVQLSAGTLETDEDQPERLQHYYTENMKGLQTYKIHMAQHYEMLEERFHHRIPSAEYIAEHQKELSELFANIQVDNHMVEGMRDLLDLTKPEDLRLFHLVRVYNAIGGHIDSIGSAVANEKNAHYREVVHYTHKPYEGIKESVRYLQEHPSGDEMLEGPKTQEEARKAQLIDKFRQIGEDTNRILTAPEAEQLDYLQRVMEMQSYVEQNKEDTSLTMQQVNGWFEMAQTRISILAKKMYYKYEQTEDNSQLTESPARWKSEINSGDPKRLLDALHELNKSVLFLQLTALPKPEVNALMKHKSWMQYEEIDETIDLEPMPEEFQKQFVQEFYEKKQRLGDLLEQAIEKEKAKLPEEMEDRELFAAYLVWQSQLGREYDAMNIITGKYFRNEAMVERSAEFQNEKKENKALAERLGMLDAKLLAAYKKYDEQFGKIGHTTALAQEEKRLFSQRFPK